MSPAQQKTVPKGNGGNVYPVVHSWVRKRPAMGKHRRLLNEMVPS